MNNKKASKSKLVASPASCSSSAHQPTSSTTEEEDLASPTSTHDYYFLRHSSPPRHQYQAAPCSRSFAHVVKGKRSMLGDIINKQEKQPMQCFSQDYDYDFPGLLVSSSYSSSTTLSKPVSSSLVATKHNTIPPPAARRDDHGVLIPSSSSTTRLKPMSTVLVNMQNTPPRHPTYLDAARKGKQADHKQGLQPLMQTREIIRTDDLDNVDHHSRPPPTPSYVGVLMANQQPLSPPASHLTANAAGASSGVRRDFLVPQQVLLPIVESLEILDYSYEDQGSFILTKLNAPKLISVGANFEKEEVPKIIEICKAHVGGLRRIQNLRGLLKKNRLVRHVKIFGGKLTILLATAQGRLLAQAMVAVIWECHSQKRSWNGTFNFEHIRIIEPCKSGEFMMILKYSMEFEGNELLLATANDLRKAAAILRSLYRKGDDLPVYFLEFLENLQNPIKELVVNGQAFMEYLRYHPAVMPSSSRSTFVSRLSNIGKGSFMGKKPRDYPDDWGKIAKSEIGKLKDKDISRDKERNDTDTISVLYTVYTDKNNKNNNNDTNYYNDRVGGLIRFMRNVSEHGKQHDSRVIHGYELELYLAKMFNMFLPSTLLTMLMEGEMERHYGEDWSSYKMSKRDKWEPAWVRIITTAEVLRL